eukprot:scaffold118100_cov33-Phaeocystis_antarctica.AAC.1
MNSKRFAEYSLPSFHVATAEQKRPPAKSGVLNFRSGTRAPPIRHSGALASALWHPRLALYHDDRDANPGAAARPRACLRYTCLHDACHAPDLLARDVLQLRAGSGRP